MATSIITTFLDTFAQLSVSADNALASEASVMDDFARDFVLAENAADNTQDAGSSISMHKRDDNDCPATSTKPVAQQSSLTIIPAVSPRQVGTREAPILVEDGRDDEGDVEHQDAGEDGVEQQDTDGEFDLLIDAFGGDTEQEDEEIEEEEMNENEDSEKENERKEKRKDQAHQTEMDAGESCLEGEGHSSGPKRSGGSRVSLRRSRPKAQRPSIIN